MRIALYVHCYFPEHYFGTEAYTRQIARHLRALGHDPWVVTATFAGEPRQTDAIERYEIDGTPVLRIDRNLSPHQNLRETYDQPSLAALHASILAEIRPDVVHVTHLMNHTASLLRECAARGVPTFATYTDFFGFCFTNKLQNAAGALCGGPDANRANCIACFLKESPPANRLRAILQGPRLRPFVARALSLWPGLAGGDAGYMRDLLIRPDVLRRSYTAYRAALAPTLFLKNAYERQGFENLYLSHFGIDIDRRAKPAREGHGIRIGYIGQLSAHKGVHLLIDAFRDVAAIGSELVIYGDENQDPAYARDLRERVANAPVTFAGSFPMEQIAEVLAAIDVLVIPSTWPENSPLILLQALATHTPVIVSDVPGLMEFVTDGVNGYVASVGDNRSLAAALARFIAHPGLAAQMSLQTNYDRTLADMATDLLAMYARHGVMEGAR